MKEEIVPGSLVVHKHSPQDLWIMKEKDNLWSTDDIPWCSGEVGLVIRAARWEEDPLDPDSIFQVLVPHGTGWVFGIDVEPV